MKAAAIVASVLFVFFLISMIRPHISISVKKDLDVFVKVLFFRRRIFTTKKRVIPAEESSAEKKEKVKKERRKKEKKSDEKTDILSLIKLLKDIVCDILKKIKKFLRIRVKNFEIVVASDDAAKTAVVYGAVGGTADIIFDMMGKAFDFRVEKNAKTEIKADFLADKTKTDIELDFSIALWQVVAMAFAALFIFIKNPIKKKKVKPSKEKDFDKSEKDNV